MIEWIFSLPEKDGQYIIKTKSSYWFGKNNVLYSNIYTDKKGKRHWSFKNQIFVAYLKE
jgi:hypothetical protein